jgi:hypothetical protein
MSNSSCIEGYNNKNNDRVKHMKKNDLPNYIINANPLNSTMILTLGYNNIR